MPGLTIIYLANVLVAGWISISCIFFPKMAVTTIFSGAYAYSESIRLVGALWGAIFVLSLLGLFYPEQMALVLLFQLIYKGAWLLMVLIPARLNRQPYPGGNGPVLCGLVYSAPYGHSLE